LGLSNATWGKIGVIAVLFAAVFWPNLRRLWQKTNPFTGEANWGHSICVPLIGLYYLYVHREELAKADARQFIWGKFTRPRRLWVSLAMIAAGAVAFVLSTKVPFFSGSMVLNTGLSGVVAIGVLGVLALVLDWSLAITLFGLGMYVYGIYPGQNDYLKDVGMVITLFGVVLLMYGWDVMRIAWFPIVFLICALPWPGLVYSWVAGPLQALAANVAVDVLKVTGVNAVCSGTKIIMSPPSVGMPPRILNVAEACAGMRSLMTFISVGAAVAFLSARPLWEKLCITVSAVPIAIFCNVMRVSGQGLLDHYVSEQLSESFAHQFVGMIMLVPAFFLILGVGVVLDKLFIDEVDDRDRWPAPPAPVAPVAAAPVASAKGQATAAAVAPVRPAAIAAPPRVAPPRVAPPRVVPPRVAPVAPPPAAGVPPRPAGLTPGTRIPPGPRSSVRPTGGIVPPRPPVVKPPQQQPKPKPPEDAS